MDSAAGIHCMQCHDLSLADFNLAVGLSIRQTAKFSGYMVEATINDKSPNEA